MLVGTTSIENSERISQLLRQAKISHEVLNAKQHEREAHIIAQAGRPGSVTIATNMAGRGTDIVLGGNLEAELAALSNPTESEIRKIKQDWQDRHQQVLASGGLHVLGTERHESRRIDNQLRGRSGRQGDAGSSRFYLSLEDPLLRIFASQRLGILMHKLGVKEDEALESTMLSRVIENAQRKVEGHNFDIRKQLLEYDNVANEQRKVMYAQRSEIMQAADVSTTIQAMFKTVATTLVEDFIPIKSFVDQWDIKGLMSTLQEEFALTLPLQDWVEHEENLAVATIQERIEAAMLEQYSAKLTEFSESTLRQLEKSILLHSLDMHWKEHLATMDYLRQGIHLRGYAQKNPKQEYKREAFDLFDSLLKAIQRDTIGLICRIQAQAAEQLITSTLAIANPSEIIYQHGSDATIQSEDLKFPEYFTDTNLAASKVRRNALCPCGSNRKFKHCHGKL